MQNGERLKIEDQEQKSKSELQDKERLAQTQYIDREDTARNIKDIPQQDPSQEG